jgi:NitT/TauT family transport system substrate-binding protein
MIRSHRVALAGALAGALLLWGAPAAPQPAPAPLEFNYGIPSADHTTVFVAEDLGLFEKAGLKPTFYSFQSGAPLLAGLKSGSLDVVTAGLALPFALGQGIPLKFLFWEANDAAGEGLVVDPKSGIKSFRDLAKARTIGAASGTCAQVALYTLAKKLGIEYDKLNVVNIPAPLFHNAFVSGSIDAGIAWPPYSVALQSDGFPVASFDADYTPAGGLCPGMTAVRPDFLKSHPEIGLKLVEVEAAARKSIRKNPQVGIDALVKHLSLTPAVAKAVLERQCCGHIPSFTDQLDPASPYSMTSKDGGLARKILVASEALFATKAVPAPLSMAVIHDAIDPAYLQQYAAAHKR